MTAFIVIRVIIILFTLLSICACIHVGFDVPWAAALIPLWLAIGGLIVCVGFSCFMHLMVAVFNAD